MAKKMLVMEFNSQEKAERVIHSNSGSEKGKRRRMHWQRYYCTGHDGGLCTKYLIFYHPLEK